jgi:hypothetical protein
MSTLCRRCNAHGLPCEHRSDVFNVSKFVSGGKLYAPPLRRCREGSVNNMAPMSGRLFVSIHFVNKVISFFRMFYFYFLKLFTRYGLLHSECVAENFIWFLEPVKRFASTWRTLCNHCTTDAFFFWSHCFCWLFMSVLSDAIT